MTDISFLTSILTASDPVQDESVLQLLEQILEALTNIYIVCYLGICLVLSVLIIKIFYSIYLRFFY